MTSCPRHTGRNILAIARKLPSPTARNGGTLFGKDLNPAYPTSRSLVYRLRDRDSEAKNLSSLSEESGTIQLVVGRREIRVSRSGR